MRDKNAGQNSGRGKIQGEGDYEAARRFNKSEQEFVRRKFGKRKVMADFDAERVDDAADQSKAIEDDEDTVRRRIIETPRPRH